jgi:aspartate/methionine/tyrosine aminotransferase
MKKISKIAENLVGQPMFELLAKAREQEKAGKNIIHYEIGDPNYSSPSNAIEAAKKALDNNMTHYSNSMGMVKFREAVAEYTKKVLGFTPSLNQILACPANAAIDFVSRCVVNAGEEVIFPNPGFPTYSSVLKYNGFTPVPIQLKEENKFRISPKDIQEKISNKTRLIIINSPQNPTGSISTKEEIKQIASIAEENDIYLLSDEVYWPFTYDTKHYSPSTYDQCKERVILLNSLSKSYSMSGWRLGYIIGPENLVKKVNLLLETIISCLPPFVQLGGIAAILGNQEVMHTRITNLKERRNFLVNGLNSLTGIKCLIPDGAFYVFPNIKDTGMSSDEYSNKLLEETGICVLPGNCFGKDGEGYVRLCYASTTMPVIQESIKKMQIFHAKHIR